MEESLAWTITYISVALPKEPPCVNNIISMVLHQLCYNVMTIINYMVFDPFMQQTDTLFGGLPDMFSNTLESTTNSPFMTITCI